MNKNVMSFSSPHYMVRVFYEERVDRLQSNTLYLRNPPLLPRELLVFTEKIEILLGKLQGSVTYHTQSTRARTISTSSSSNSEVKKLKVTKDLASTEIRAR